MEYHEIKLLFDLPALRILRGPSAVMVLRRFAAFVASISTKIHILR